MTCFVKSELSLNDHEDFIRRSFTGVRFDIAQTLP